MVYLGSYDSSFNTKFNEAYKKAQEAIQINELDIATQHVSLAFNLIEKLSYPIKKEEMVLYIETKLKAYKLLGRIYNELIKGKSIIKTTGETLSEKYQTLLKTIIKENKGGLLTELDIDKDLSNVLESLTENDVEGAFSYLIKNYINLKREYLKIEVEKGELEKEKSELEGKVDELEKEESMLENLQNLDI